MAEARAALMDRDRSPGESLAVPLLIWLGLQLLALVLSAAQVPLSARFVEPAERAGIHVMISVQVGASALLFPILLANWRAAVAVAASSWVFLTLAGFLSGTATDRLGAAGLYVTLWLAAAAVWNHILQSYRSRLFGVAAAAALALGGPVLWYVRAEFGLAEPHLDWPTHGMFGPMMGALAQIEQERFSLGPWFVTGVLVVGSAGVAMFRRATARAI